MDLAIYPGRDGHVVEPAAEHCDVNFHLLDGDASFSTADYTETHTIEDASVSLLQTGSDGRVSLKVAGWATRKGEDTATYQRWQVTLTEDRSGS